jgi:predicted pyridoxine 5'-phosphate oxidase superfamily flavin-nucleotide-binding protein
MDAVHHAALTGERALQEALGTSARAEQFYSKQVLDHLNAEMSSFVSRQSMAFLATADAQGNCDCSFRAGPPGFMQVLDPHTLAFPEYRGNGVMASAGNIVENGHVALLFIDFCQDVIGLHVNGPAELVEPPQMRERAPLLAEDPHPVHAVAVGPGPGRRGLRALLQAHPPVPAAAQAAALGDGRPQAQGRRLLPRGGVRRRTSDALPGPVVRPLPVSSSGGGTVSGSGA